jgi:hypothetical protein
MRNVDAHDPYSHAIVAADCSFFVAQRTDTIVTRVKRSA